MKKILSVLPFVILLAVGCNSSRQVSSTPPGQTGTTQVLGSVSSSTTTPSGSTNSNSKPTQIDCKNYKGHGVTLSCPKGFYLEDYEDVYKGNTITELTFYNHNKIYNLEEGSVYAVYIGISKDTFNGSINNFLKTDLSIKLNKQTMLDGKTAYILMCAPNSYTCQNEEVVFADGNVYEFANSPVGSETLPIYNFILASVKFLSQ